MLDVVKNFYATISFIDLTYLIVTISSVIKCYSKGFVLSLLSDVKWLLAFAVTLILFPKVEPYFKGMIDNEYILNITLNLVIFILAILIIAIANNMISKTVRFVGLGKLDTLFGLFFGFIRGYMIYVFLLTAISIVYNYNKWPVNTDKSYTFPYIEKGSNYLVKVFPNEKKYQDSKEKIEEL